MKKYLLGVKIDDVNMDEAISLVEKWVWNPGRHYVVTPNPEIIMAAQKDPALKKILNDADLSIPDGAGLKLSGAVHNTVPGVDLMERLIAISAEKGFTTGFLGGRDEVAKKCAECLKKKYPGLKVTFAENGGEVNESGEVLDSKTRSNNNIQPVDILFVAFGHIKQEKWIADNLDQTPVHVAMAVGGAFDYLSGSVARAPGWVRSAGCEWLFRLITQPWRITRQIVLVGYAWLVIKERFLAS